MKISQKKIKMNNYYRRQEFARKNLKDLINEGLKQMGTQGLSEDMYQLWVEYSKKVIEISTREFNAEILLNYLRVVLSINPQLQPYQKIGICLDYLIGVLRII